MTIDLADGLARKLALKPGMRLFVLGAPPGYVPALRDALMGITIEEAAAATLPEAALVFVRDLAELQHLAARSIDAVRRDGLLWIAYPKGGSGVKTDLKRDVVPPVFEPFGYQPVSQIALDATWSALRFRPAEAVGT